MEICVVPIPSLTYCRGSMRGVNQANLAKTYLFSNVIAMSASFQEHMRKGACNVCHALQHRLRAALNDQSDRLKAPVK